jgi:phospholipid/cholesterol/gamma-HCH transport system substrate-binding protein
MVRGRAPHNSNGPTDVDRNPNYVAVGAFVLLVIAMAASFVFWYTGQQDKRTYQRYEIYFDGSISGLSAGSPVRYLGVDVGKVVRISLDPQQRTRVQVIAEVDSSAPLDAGTLASLGLQGVTGLLFIDLQEDPKSKANGPLPQGQHYPVINASRSNIDVFLSTLPALATHMVELVDRFTVLFSEDNVRALTATLENAKRASERLPDTVRDVQGLVADVRHATQEVQGIAAEMRGVVHQAAPDVEAAVANIRKVSETLTQTSERLDHFVLENEPGLSRFTRQSLPEIEQLLRESRQAARDFRDLSRSLKANPSQLIYESNYRGVEVPP